MIAGSFKDGDETVRRPAGTDEGVLPVAAIYGANASGKTNVVLAMRFMAGVVRDSHASWEPDKPIQLEPFAGQSDTPSTFSMDFLLRASATSMGPRTRPREFTARSTRSRMRADLPDRPAATVAWHAGGRGGLIPGA